MAQWSNSAVLKFLEAYRAEPALWDPSDERNKDRIAVQATWRRLSQTLKIPVPDLKRKKESLMATYRYYARKRRLTKRSAGSADDVYQPTWYAFKYMDQFLNKVYKGVDTLDATQAQDDIEYSEYYIESSPIEQETEHINIDDSPRSQQRNTTKRRRKRRRLTPVQLEVASDLEVEDSSAATFNNIVPKKAKEESEDDCELYGKLLAMKLRRLPEWQRQIVMYELDGIVLNKLNQFKTSQSSFASSTRVVKSPTETGEESISE